MSMVQSGVLTYTDYAALPDDGVRRELVDGAIFVTPSANTRHQDLCGEIYVAFKNFLRANGGGRIFIAPYDVVLSDRNVVEPDVVFVADDRLDIITPRNIQGVPSLAVEVVSDPRHDRIRKRELYARFGIPEYWIVDPDADRIEVHRLQGGGYPKPEIFECGDTLTYALLAGFALDIEFLFSL